MIIAVNYIILIVVLVILYYAINTQSFFVDNTSYTIPLVNKILNANMLPVISFKINNKPYFFLLDTASAYCILDYSKLSEFTLNNPSLVLSEESEHTVVGIGGRITPKTQKCKLDLSYKDLNFSSDFITIDLEESLRHTNSILGIDCIGLIGIDFIKKYKLKINFKKNIVTGSYYDLCSNESTQTI